MTFEKVRDIICDKLDVEASKISMDTDILKDLEADSLDAVEVILGVEDEFGVEIPDDAADSFQTVADIVKFIDENK